MRRQTFAGILGADGGIPPIFVGIGSFLCRASLLGRQAFGGILWVRVGIPPIRAEIGPILCRTGRCDRPVWSGLGRAGRGRAVDRARQADLHS